jgi:DnaJ-class molecular chaperone
MKSAYAVLGIPGNSSPDEIDSAYQMYSNRYPPEVLAKDPSLQERLAEIHEAYKILSKPELRLAHDRKLNSSTVLNSPRQRVLIEEVESTWYSKPLNILIMVVLLIFVFGSVATYLRQQERKEQAARILAQQKLELEQAALAQRQEEMLLAEKARKNAESEQKERQIRNESVAVARITATQNLIQEGLNQRAEQQRIQEERRKVLEKRNDDRQAQIDAARRLALDRQRIRDLCWQNYRRYDC